MEVFKIPVMVILLLVFLFGWKWLVMKFIKPNPAYAQSIERLTCEKEALWDTLFALMFWFIFYGDRIHLSPDVLGIGPTWVYMIACGTFFTVDFYIRLHRMKKSIVPSVVAEQAPS